MKNSSSSSSWHLYGWFVCLIGAIFYSYEYFLRITPSVMINELRDSFGITAFAVGNLAAYYYYVYTPMQLPVGMLMDRFGPRKLLAFACFVCAIGAYLFAYTQSLPVAAGGRVLMGFGSAFAFVGVLSLAAHWLPPQNFALVAGLTTSLGMLGGMQGQIILAQLVDGIGWRETLIYSAHVGVILTVIIYLCIRDKKNNHADTLSHPPLTFKVLTQGLFKALSNPQILLAGAIGSLLYLSLSAFAEMWAVAYLETVYQFNKVDSAKAVSMVFLGWAIAGPIAGYISDRMERRVLPLTVSSIMATVFCLILLYVPNLSLTALYVSLFLFGAFCSSEIIVFALGRENSPPHLAGIGIATVNMLVMVGGVITQPLIGRLLDIFVGSDTTVYSTAAFQKAMLLLPVGTLVAALLTYFVRETNCIIPPAKH